MARFNRATEQLHSAMTQTVVERLSEGGDVNEATSINPLGTPDMHTNADPEPPIDREKPVTGSVASVDIPPATERLATEETSEQVPTVPQVSSAQPTTSLEQVIVVPPSTSLPRTPPSARSLGSGSSSRSESTMGSTDSTQNEMKTTSYTSISQDAATYTTSAE